jgi:phosphate transport system substrate-binding protein
MTRLLAVGLFVATAVVSGCKPHGGAPVMPGDSAGSSGLTINGAGATFPDPIYARWAHGYKQLTGTGINYQAIGSGAGIDKIKSKLVDFGASDAPLKAEELSAAELIQFPMVVGGVVPVVHLEGVDTSKLHLSSELLAAIFMGDVKKWNDERIQELNADLKLPATDIAVVHRSDGSGTTWIFTSFLSEVSSEWKKRVGAEKAVEWPAGWGGKGNDGVANYVGRIDGAIGYVEYAYALQLKMSTVRLKNKAGKVVEPTIETFQAAAASADWKNAPGFYMVLINQPGEKSWPITGASFILLRKEQADPARAAAMLKFFDWCLKHGGDDAKSLHYVPMPDSVVDLVEASWDRELLSGGKPISH